MSEVTFSIRESHDNGRILFEVWRRSCDSYGECLESLLAECDTRAEARKLQSQYATSEKQKA